MILAEPTAFERRWGHAANADQRDRPDHPHAFYKRHRAVLPEEHRRRATELGFGTGMPAGPLGHRFRPMLGVHSNVPGAENLAGRVPHAAKRSAMRAIGNHLLRLQRRTISFPRTPAPR